MPTLSEQQLDTIREQLKHLEELTQGDWRAKDDDGQGLVWSRTILKLIKTLDGLHLQRERFNWYKRFKVPMKLITTEQEVLIRNEDLSPLEYCDAVTQAISELVTIAYPFEIVNVRLLLNQTGELMADED